MRFMQGGTHASRLIAACVAPLQGSITPLRLPFAITLSPIEPSRVDSENVRAGVRSTFVSVWVCEVVGALSVRVTVRVETFLAPHHGAVRCSVHVHLCAFSQTSMCPTPLLSQSESHTSHLFQMDLQKTSMDMDWNLEKSKCWQGAHWPLATG